MSSYRIFEEEDNLPVSVLDEPVSLQDLEAGTDIAIDPFESAIEHELKERVRQDTTQNEFNENYFSLGKDGKGNDLRGNPGVDHFETLAEKMTPIVGDNRIRKRILRAGQLGPEIPEDAIVEVHYNAYLEFGNGPFDSTFATGKSRKFSLLDCIEGLAIAIRSMKLKERAQVLLHPDMAYKNQGIPPRIPASADILYEIELISFESGENESGGSAKDFKTIFARAKANHLEANECFSRSDVHGAVNSYYKALHMLEKCNLANKEEEIEQEALLLKLYNSLAVCLNLEKKSRQACNMCKCALRLKPNHAKAFYNYGKALMLLGDYKESLLKLQRALHLRPNDLDIKELIQKVEAKQQEYLAGQKLFATKIFSQSENKQN